MAKRSMVAKDYTTLTATRCNNANATEGVYYLPDRGPESVPGLRLCIRPNGSKLWMLRFTKLGAPTPEHPHGERTESTAGLGVFPEIGLSKAREKAREARADVAVGIHPKSGRRARKVSNVQAEAATLKVISDEWLAHNKADWSAHHYERNDGLLRRILLPKLGALPIKEISEPMLLAVLRKSYDGGTRESARRARAVAAQVFRFAMDTKRADTNPALALANSTVLKKPEVRNFAALKSDQVGPMLRALAVSGTEPATKAALLLMLLTGLRDAALRGARWSEIDLPAATWTVPADRMKSGRVHKIPLPAQALATLEQLAKLTRRGPSSFIFASTSKAGFLAENTLRLTLHRLGFKVTVHGFRSLLTDLLNTRGFNADAIERQLDHVQRDKVRASYLRTDFFDQRRPMMQWLADWAQAQQAEADDPPMPANVVDIRRAA